MEEEAGEEGGEKDGGEKEEKGGEKAERVESCRQVKWKLLTCFSWAGSSIPILDDHQVKRPKSKQTELQRQKKAFLCQGSFACVFLHFSLQVFIKARQ